MDIFATRNKIKKKIKKKKKKPNQSTLLGRSIHP